MNRILFEAAELTRESAASGSVTFTGERARHVMEVLHGELGQLLKTGEVNGPIGTSEIQAIERLSDGEYRITARYQHSERALSSWVDLILAPPRPRVLKRLLPQLTSLGVGRLVLVGAQKVEKDFWGATLLKAENYRPLLIEGLMQAGTTALPTIELRRNFRKFVREELPMAFPDTLRIVAHPAPMSTPLVKAADQRLLLAIGPEGGWTEAEVELLKVQGFATYSLGPRILRTDTATIALLAQLMKELSL